MLGSPLPAPPVGASVSWWEPWGRGRRNLRGRGVGAGVRVRAGRAGRASLDGFQKILRDAALEGRSCAPVARLGW